MHILLAVDGSECSVRAAQVLARQAGLYREPPRLTLLTVALPIGTPLARSQLSRETLEAYYRDIGRQALAPARAVLAAAGLAFDEQVVVGDPAEQIAAVVKRFQPDLLVMGTHGHSALKGFVMGSVAAKVMAATSVPLLLAR